MLKLNAVESVENDLSTVYQAYVIKGSDKFL